MALQNFLIPLVNAPQTFEISLAGINYNITNKYNPLPDTGWVIDIADSESNPIVVNVPLITGADCLEGLEYLGIQGSLFVYTDGDPTAVPTEMNLGVQSNLYFQTEVASNG